MGVSLAYFFLCFAIALGLQSLSPYQLNTDRLGKNLKNNLSLGLVGYVTVGYFGKLGLLFLISKVASKQFGLLYWMNISLALKVILGILALDLTAFVWHIANHRSKFLWRFHLVHHTDRVFDPSTALRFHPVEIFISLLVRASVIMTLGISIESLAIFEAVYLFFNFIEHGNIYVTKELRTVLHPIFITPALHVLHHTRNTHEQNSNFGTIFSFWDRVFGTFLGGEPIPPVKFGVIEFRESLSLKALLKLPFEYHKKQP